MHTPTTFARHGLGAVAAILIPLFASAACAQQPIPGYPVVQAAAMVPQPPPEATPPEVVPATLPTSVPTTPARPEAPVPGAVALPENAGPVLGHDHPHLYDSLHQNDNYGLKSLFDSLHPKPDGKAKHWYEKLAIGGYFQFRFDRTTDTQPGGADPFMTTDRGVNGNAEAFSIRRARFVISGDVSEHLFFYWQQEWAITLPGTTAPDFGQIRDLYADVYIDKEKVHRLRIGQSKLPYGFDNMQSSQNRVTLDRSDALNGATNFVERDLGVFYYWTPEEKQKLLKDLTAGGLKGTGNYGIFALGVYNGQGLSQLEQNLNLYTVARLTYPWLLPSGQVVEASIQGYTGEYVVTGAAIRPLGAGAARTPTGTGDHQGFRDQRIAGTLVWYPQPFGIQTEWNFGEGPGLNDAQTAINVRPLNGGYTTLTYKIDTASYGIFIPYTRYQYFKGGYKNFANTPYGTRNQYDVGVEWQIRKEMELTVEYSFVNGVNLNAINTAGATSYRNFDGGVLRAQFQVNY